MNMDTFGDYAYDAGTLSHSLPYNSLNDSGCFNYSNQCSFHFEPCKNTNVHSDIRYTAESASWVLIASILVFFMKAGFMLMELAFARDPKEKRHVVVLKHQDAFASAFGFFLLGFNFISQYSAPQGNTKIFFGVTDPVLWFFKFTFASNAATIVGGCLVTNRYKLRIPAAFISAFVISGIIHPAVARIIWSDACDSLSPYRFCDYGPNYTNRSCSANYSCSAAQTSLKDRMYVLDFAGGGAVHLIGGIAGLVLCMFAKLEHWRETQRKTRNENSPLLNRPARGAEKGEPVTKPKGFWTWMYPVHGGDEAISEAALGVLILWFSWFAFNCGSTGSIEISHKMRYGQDWSDEYPYYNIPAIIAVNMIMAGASGGIIAVIIAVWAQIRYRTESVNANEIANGVLSALVSITSGCAFVDYWGACLIGSIGVLLYHIGCFIEYKMGIEDTARVVPVHGLCGLWSLLATGLFLAGDTAECNLHVAFEGLCFCVLRLPELSYVERLLSQFVAGLIMIGIGGGGAFLTYFTLYIIPIGPFTRILDKMFCLTPKDIDGKPPTTLKFAGGWLLTSPEDEVLQPTESIPDVNIDIDPLLVGGIRSDNVGATQNLKARKKTRKSEGTVRSYGTAESKPTMTARSLQSLPRSSGTNDSAAQGHGHQEPACGEIFWQHSTESDHA